MRGVRSVDLTRHTDGRGSLIPFAVHSEVPFDVRNVYFILDCPPDAVRAGHAGSDDKALIVLNSSVTVELDNGSERQLRELTGPETALVVQAGVWLLLKDLAPDTVIAVLASQPHDETTHFDAPAPALLDAVSR
jgi:hypothetical protein